MIFGIKQSSQDTETTFLRQEKIESDNIQDNSGKKYENYANIELPKTIFYVKPIQSKNTQFSVEGMDNMDNIDTNQDLTKLDMKKTMRQFKKIVMAPVAFLMNLDPTLITDNKVTNNLINTLAGPNIINRIFFDASSSALSFEVDEKEDSKNSSMTWMNMFDIDYYSNRAKELSDKKKLEESNSKLKNMLNNAYEGNTVEPSDPPPSNTSTNTSRNNKNRNLENDRAILKDYIFKTVLVIFSFFAVYNWAYVFIFFKDFYKIDPDEENCDAYGVSDNSDNFGNKDKNKCPNYGDSSMEGIPVIGGLLMFIYNFVEKIIKKYNPFYLAHRFFKGLSKRVTYISDKDIDRFFNKETWFLLIFAFTYFSSVFFIQHYQKYMKDIRNMKQNKWIAFFYVCCFMLYLMSFITDFGIIGAIRLYLGGLMQAIWLFLKNVFIIFLITINPYFILFFGILLFICISLFGIAIYPKFSFSEIGNRYNKLIETIEDDYISDTSDSLIWSIFRFFVHFIYKNLTFIALGIWILFLYITLKKKLKYNSLKENVYIILGFSMFLLITIFLLRLTFGGGTGMKSEKEE